MTANVMEEHNDNLDHVQSCRACQRRMIESGVALAADNARLRAELAALRLIVTEKFARDVEVVVKPEDAADVAKWAANPQHVRELLARGVFDEADETEGRTMCVDCYAPSGASHGSTITALDDRRQATPRRRVRCRIAAAWRALGDPRGAEDIERAHEEAIRMATLRARNPEVTEAIRAAEVERLSSQIY